MGISQHKVASTKLPTASLLRPNAQSAAQSFDIVPRGKVMPSPTTRPVIMRGQPIQADNTLVQVPSAPTLEKLLASNAKKAEVLKKRGFMSAADPQSAVLSPAPSLDPSLPPGVSPKVSSEVSSKNNGIVTTGAPVLLAPVVAEAKSRIVGERTIAPPSHESEPSAKKTTTEHLEESEASQLATSGGPLVGPDEQSDNFEAAIEGFDDSDTPDTLSETTNNKDLLNTTEPQEVQLYGGKSVIVIHESHPARDALKSLLWFIFFLGIALVAFNFLLDAGVVSTGYDIPHTDVLEPGE